ncbi:phosphoglycerate kinase [Thermosulfurimonas dismutans]|uniref:Phosphoglycerate kinase n=1 Tax=Thermosulfurimonas dismutans TaxID=999894 RepID=A0A179D258_9BACT|nr:phosphoglycerate kinase [Thermosulfurimonas dismutans]OAQ19891.1 Phosphoglycerate kinase [Thermosulfurimonas dismutans]
MGIRDLSQIEVAGRRVLVRVDYNVPLSQGQVVDDTRIRASLATIKYLMEKGARIILCSHLGRPKGQRVPELSLKPVAVKLSELLGKSVRFAEDCIGEVAERAVEELAHGEILLLENLRFHKGETKNDPAFAEALARLCEVYVNDAFSVSHRAHASVVGIPERVPAAAAGFQLKREVDYLTRALEAPEKPFVAVVGGAKISGKIEVLRNLISKVDKLIIGGAMANTFLAAEGLSLGKSLVEDSELETAREILLSADERGVKVYLPVDAVVAEDEEGRGMQEVSVSEVLAEAAIYDIGSETVRLFSGALSEAGTIVWNGPLGLFEKPPFAKGTVGIARAIAESSALTLAGGGDTLSAIRKAGVIHAFSYLSTGGGAFLEFLEGKELPGIAVLKMKS